MGHVYFRKVTSGKKPQYHVYFPEDSETREDIPEEELQKSDGTGFWARSRMEFVGNEFDHDQKPSPIEKHKSSVEQPAGKHTIVAVGAVESDSSDINKYVCKNEEGEELYFDIGYVLKSYLHEDSKK